MFVFTGLIAAPSPTPIIPFSAHGNAPLNMMVSLSWRPAKPRFGLVGSIPRGAYTSAVPNVWFRLVHVTEAFRKFVDVQTPPSFDSNAVLPSGVKTIA